ncbi:PREDICTED: uncharacterized protein LOC109391364 [Hipposideros armiger]|uniref:Uncharacterized protein LOC109391364 n=1 Tax=Hipposideros armiger TaxID=186990 RepID=A0A8B7SQS3_HIPAR|nr:PREDICTED: uncharacterized protein LOC109391364 [Hipposideros armiger]
MARNGTGTHTAVPQSTYLAAVHWGVGSRNKAPLFQPHVPSEGGTPLTAWESGELFVGAHCSREGARRLRGHTASWRGSQAASPALPFPPLSPPRPSRRDPIPARGRGPARAIRQPFFLLLQPFLPRPPAPHLRLVVCARVSGASPPHPARPGPARPPPPSRRTGPLAARPRARDWDQSSAAPARAPAARLADLGAARSRPPAPPHPPGTPALSQTCLLGWRRLARAGRRFLLRRLPALALEAPRGAHFVVLPSRATG